MFVCPAPADYRLLREVVRSKGQQLQSQPEVCLPLYLMSSFVCYTVSLTASALVLNYHLNLVLLRLSSVPPAPSELSSSGTIASSVSRITPVRTPNRLSV